MSAFLAGCTWLLVFQCAGEALVRLAGSSIPGPVVGMGLLFIVLAWRGRIPDAIGAAADGLARHLSLLFVPAGVGVMLYAKQLAAEWLPIVAALVVSTALAIATTALVFRWLSRRASVPHER
jgi:holin-like protein